MIIRDRSTAFAIIALQNKLFSSRPPIPDGRKAVKNARYLLHLASLRHMPVSLVSHAAPADSVAFTDNSEAAKLQPDIKPHRQENVSAEKHGQSAHFPARI
ncbi:isochorismatase family protein [Burkholderia stabilis]|uniref:isochorismatase family protein n=1 Tax=Burkholderia stabilis TaxID=95485 RepID=UPI0013E8FC68|nr:isochorismatase family protein [Burkholderia stabilis]